MEELIYELKPKEVQGLYKYTKILKICIWVSQYVANECQASDHDGTMAR